ncbi:hypothetical protein [Paenibacillus sp. HB172176]|uniref:hypothetical protein n=1 Tax=Paenibacillus sp. HB172176 TaxID=2493690 RepID=UPI00143BE780|nr:hypothetical protein [Paenibacillus sp. HB172176]
MTTKRLPMHDHDYKTYPNVAHLFSIIGNREETLPWIYSHFIQLVYFESMRKIDYTNKKDSFFDPLLFDCPWLHFQFTHRDTITKVWKGSIVQFAVDAIDMGNYVYFLADQFHIREADAYGKHSHNHDMFIYGYDAEAGTLNIADNLRGGKYTETVCSFEEMELAYAHADAERDWFDQRVMSVSFKPKTYFQYERNVVFDSLAVVDALERYVSGWKPTSYLCAENTYGIEIYDRMQEYLNALMQEQEIVDIRLLHILYEHKKIMRRRLRYMLEHGFLTNAALEPAYAEVERGHQIAVGMLLKYSVSGEKKLIDRMAATLLEGATLEKELLGRVIVETRHRQMTFIGGVPSGEASVVL